MYCMCSLLLSGLLKFTSASFLQFASKSSDQQTSLQIICYPQIATIKSVRLSEDQAKGRMVLLHRVDAAIIYTKWRLQFVQIWILLQWSFPHCSELGLQEKLSGDVWSISQNPFLFKTKIRDYSHSLYDLI